MFRYVVVRVWLEDRPGSLGQIATKIGELGGDLLGIDILERDGARAVDELTIEVPDGCEPGDLVAALTQLSGVEVEDLRQRVSQAPFAGRDPLDVAILVAESICHTGLLNVLAKGLRATFACDWCAVLDAGGADLALVKVGNPPSAAWLVAFIAGARAGQSLAKRDNAELIGPRDVAWAELPSSGLVVVAGRDGPPFRSRERHQVQKLCRVADAKWGELSWSGVRSVRTSRSDNWQHVQLNVS